MTLDDLRAALENANVKAFLRLIREKESGQGDDAYTVINGGAHFTDASRHPYHGITTGKGGRAAGAYQFLGTTWARLCEQYGFPDFGPESQDLGAVALIAGRRALNAVIAGDIETAIRLCRPEWTSLPGAAESRASWTMAAAVACFEHWGGSVTYPDRADEPAPVEEREIPTGAKDMADTSTSFDWSQVAKVGGAIASLFNPIVGAGITAFAPLLQQKIEGTLSKHGNSDVAKTAAASLTSAIMDTAKQVTGKLDDFEAIAEMRKSPQAIAAVEQAVTAKLSELEPLLDRLAALDAQQWASEDASRVAAHERSQHDTLDLGTPLTYAALWGVGLLTLFVGVVIVVQLVKDGIVGTEMWAALTGLIGWITAKAGSIYDYRFGSSRQSAAKDVIIGTLSRGRT